MRLEAYGSYRIRTSLCQVKEAHEWLYTVVEHDFLLLQNPPRFVDKIVAWGLRPTDDHYG